MKKYVMIVLVLLIIIVLSGMFLFIGYNLNPNNKVEKSSLSGVWISDEKILEIIERDGSNIITNDSGNNFYLFIYDDGTFYSFTDEIVNDVYSANLNEGKYSIDENNDVFLNFENEWGDQCRLVDNNRLECNKYAHFKKIK